MSESIEKEYGEEVLNSLRKECPSNGTENRKKLRRKQSLEGLAEEEKLDPRNISYNSLETYYEDYRKVKNALPDNIDQKILILRNLLKEVVEDKANNGIVQESKKIKIEVEIEESNGFMEDAGIAEETQIADEVRENKENECVPVVPDNPLLKDPLTIKSEEIIDSCSASNYETSDEDSLIESQIKVEEEEVQEVVVETETIVIDEDDNPILESSCHPIPDFWQPETIKLFLDLFKRYRSLFYNHHITRVYSFLSHKISEVSGIVKSPEECQIKYTKLIRIYKSRKVRENNERFPYFQQMNQIQNEQLEIGVDSQAENEFKKFCSERNEIKFCVDL